MKRYRAKKAKPNSIRASFGKVDGELDVVISWDGVQKPDARLTHNIFASQRFGFNGYQDRSPSFLVELIRRGYDIRTLDFNISKLDDSDEEGRNINDMMLKSLERQY